MFKSMFIGALLSIGIVYGGSVEEVPTRNSNQVIIKVKSDSKAEFLYDKSLRRILNFDQDFVVDGVKLYSLHCEHTFMENVFECNIVKYK